MRAACVTLLVAAIARAGAVAGARQDEATGLTETTIGIGVESAVGSLSLDGENLGFQLAFEEANAAGGVHGRRFVWTERRRRSGEPADVLAVARQMIDEDHVFALVNFSGPAIGDIVAHARAARVPVLFPHTALVSSEGERYLFTSFPRFEGEAEVMFRYLAEDRGLRRLAIAHDPNAYGAGFRDRAAARTPARFGTRSPARCRSPRASRAIWPRRWRRSTATGPDGDRDGALSGAGPGPDGGARAGRLARPHGLDRAAHRRGVAGRARRQRRWHARLLPLSRPRAQRRPRRRPLSGGGRAPAARAARGSLHALRLHLRPAGRRGRRRAPAAP